MIDPNKYSTFIFDCDGVVLNSNFIKADAFYRTVLPFGKGAADAMVKYHLDNQGVSRYKKFQYFLKNIAPKFSDCLENYKLEFLLKTYSCFVRNGLIKCEIAPGLIDLRQKLPNAYWLIVSGGDQAELREVFDLRGITEIFDKGIFGSPDTKEKILRREISAGSIQFPALFLGDSKYDYQAATAFGIDFVFISAWSDLNDWKFWVRKNHIECTESVGTLFKSCTLL